MSIKENATTIVISVLVFLLALTASFAFVQWRSDEPVIDAGKPRDPPVFFKSLPTGYHVESVASGLTFPTSIDGAPDGRIFVAEQTGNVRVIGADGVLDPEPYYVVPDLLDEASVGLLSELGLVGLTVEPDASDGLQLYLYYSAEQDDGRRSTKLVRIEDEGGRGARPETIVEVDARAECCHIGGALTWLPDGTLLVGVGDHEDPASAQDRASPKGAVLRINPDGSPPPDNPFAGDDGADPRLFAYGLRNPFGVAANGLDRAFVLDNGDFGLDSVNALTAGGNYGWPAYARPDGFVLIKPLHMYLESTGLAGAIVYDGPLDAFDDDLLFCQYHNGGALHWFDAEANEGDRDSVLGSGCSSSLRQLPDGAIYLLDWVPGEVRRIVAGATPAAQTP